MPVTLPTIRRLFGIAPDATAGGTMYDDLTGSPKEPPISTIWWPVTGATFDPSIERIDRSAEVRQTRAMVAPLPFRARPMTTIQVPAYPKVLEESVKKVVGTVVTTGGPAPTPYVHTVTPYGFGNAGLPAVHAQIVRDDLNYIISGNVFNRLTANFPLDGEGTLEFELNGLYYVQDSSPVPVATFTGYNEVYMLRDGVADWFDGATTNIQDLQGFSMTFVNNAVPKWYAGKNVVTSAALGTGTYAQTKKLWYPATNKMGAAEDVTFSIQLGNADIAAELSRDWNQIRKLTFTCTADPLGGTFTGNKVLVVTFYNAVLTGGGAEALSARDDITSSFDGGAFTSSIDSKDVQIALTSAVATIS